MGVAAPAAIRFREGRANIPLRFPASSLSPHTKGYAFPAFPFNGCRLPPAAAARSIPEKAKTATTSA